MSALSRAIVVLVMLAGVAGAQPSPEAKKLFEQGRELAKQQQWALACEQFTKSLALDPAPGTKLNLGDCLEKQGRVRAGWLMFEEAARDFDRLGDARAKFAHERAASASAKLATIVIRVSESSRPGLTVRVGDRDTTPQPEIVERVDPGELFVSVAAPDKQVFVTGVVAVAGKTAIVDVPELKDAIKDPGPAPVQPGNPRRTRVRIAIGLGVGGVLTLAAGGLLGLSAKAQYDDAFDDGECFKTADGNLCTEKGLAEIKDAGTRADLATGIAIGGVAIVAASVIVYVTAPKARGVIVAPTATSSSAGLVLGGTF
jgi:tetratricopeptide (TPR) repeat protein